MNLAAEKAEQARKEHDTGVIDSFMISAKRLSVSLVLCDLESLGPLFRIGWILFGRLSSGYRAFQQRKHSGSCIMF